QVTKVYQINFPYSQMSSVMGFLKKWELPQIKQNFDVECTLQTEIRLGDSEMFEEFFEDLEESKAALLAIK
ncbi:MAG: putative IMPACT (imprinted ancient) family translation regulator, partial [Flavobacteriales bacterium]